MFPFYQPGPGLFSFRDNSPGFLAHPEARETFVSPLGLFYLHISTHYLRKLLSEPLRRVSLENYSMWSSYFFVENTCRDVQALVAEMEDIQFFCYARMENIKVEVQSQARPRKDVA